MSDNLGNEFGNNMGDIQNEHPITPEAEQPVYTNPNPVAEQPVYPNPNPVAEQPVYTNPNPVAEQPVYTNPNPVEEAPPIPDVPKADEFNYSYGQNSNYQQNTNYHPSQNYQPTQGYVAPAQNSDGDFDTTPMTMKDWILTLLVFLIPCCAGPIIYCVWAFGKKGNLNRRNFCRAALIVALGVFLVSFIVGVLYAGVLVSIIDNFSYYY